MAKTYRILIVDQDSSSVKYLSYQLIKDGYQVSGASSAKEGLISAYRDRPHIIIIDPVMKDISPFEFVNRLRKDKRTAKSRLIALSSLKDPGEIQNTIDIGFDYYLEKESKAIQALLEVIAKMIAGEALFESDSEPVDIREALSEQGTGKLIVFLSAKGGTGTSSICANMGYMFHKLQPESRVAVVDMVLPIGSIASIVGFEGEPNLVTVSKLSSADADAEYFNRALPLIKNWDFYLLAGSRDPDQAAEANAQHIPVHINTLTQVYEYVLVDLGRSLSRISLPIITSADLTVLILSLDQATVTLTLRVLEYLNAKGLKRNQIYPLINRAVGLEGLPKRDVDEMLQMEITGNIPHIGGTFSLANNANQPVPLRYPDNIVGVALREIVEHLIKEFEDDGSTRIPGLDMLA